MHPLLSSSFIKPTQIDRRSFIHPDIYEDPFNSLVQSLLSTAENLKPTSESEQVKNNFPAHTLLLFTTCQLETQARCLRVCLFIHLRHDFFRSFCLPRQLPPRQRKAKHDKAYPIL